MKRTAILVALLSGLVSNSTAQITDFKAKTYTYSIGNKLHYRLLKPANYDSLKSYPLVLFLHGAGERGNDNFSQLKWGVYRFAEPQLRDKYPAFVVAPQVPKGQSWAGIRLQQDSTTYNHLLRTEPTQPMRLTMELLQKLQDQFSIDAGRLYVTGYSMGGFGTFDIIERNPREFAAAAPISGGGDITRAFLFKDFPIWIFHGAQDKIVSPQYSQSMVSAIKIAGGTPGFTLYPDKGHIGAWVEAYNDPNLYKWLFSQDRDKQN
ncbi:MAG TPA: prolyl oligopeptidase family serine peptidase [Balneolaceae bacterium]|nr:prolyl oligopeptidase family serine peptidase [Balneolaceae bacterium]